MSIQKQSDKWEQDFDNKFDIVTYAGSTAVANSHIKQFIRNLLKKQKKESYNKGFDDAMQGQYRKEYDK